MTNDTTRPEGTVHAALALYDPKGTYSQHAGVVMTSIFENTAPSSYTCCTTAR